MFMNDSEAPPAPASAAPATPAPRCPKVVWFQITLLKLPDGSVGVCHPCDVPEDVLNDTSLGEDGIVRFGHPCDVPEDVLNDTSLGEDGIVRFGHDEEAPTAAQVAVALERFALARRSGA
jgi:hypothetical protein